VVGEFLFLTTPSSLSLRLSLRHSLSTKYNQPLSVSRTKSPSQKLPFAARKRRSDAKSNSKIALEEKSKSKAAATAPSRKKKRKVDSKSQSPSPSPCPSPSPSPSPAKAKSPQKKMTQSKLHVPDKVKASKEAVLRAQDLTRSIEQLVMHDSKLLAQFHNALADIVPLKYNAWQHASSTLKELYGESLHTRVSQQIAALGEAASNFKTRFSAYRCTSTACSGSKSSLLQTMCSICGSSTVTAARPMDEKRIEAFNARRENATLRALRYTTTASKRNVDSEFEHFAGDIVFLFRYIVTNARGKVHDYADKMVRQFIKRYEKSEYGALDAYCEVEHLMQWVELNHGKMDLDLLDDAPDARERVKKALLTLPLDEVIKYDPHEWEHELPKTQAGYCVSCGEFANLGDEVCNLNGCGRELKIMIDYQNLCECLVWVSVFNELGVEMTCCDGTATMHDILGLIRDLRPYKSLDELGRDAFAMQVYFITHLMFVLSRWGRFEVVDRHLLAEEFLFMQAAIAPSIELNDPEIVGELVQGLKILGACDDNIAVMLGRKFLLKAERRGNFVDDNDDFYKRYHAAYCGAIGLVKFYPTARSHINPDWKKHFEHTTTRT
jgi:hypothetical protein